MFGRQRIQKNSPVPWFRQLTRQNKASRSKKIQNEPFFHVQVPMFGIFLGGCASALRQWRAAICHVWTSKNPKKNSPVPRFRQLTRQNKASKSKKVGNQPF